MTVSANLDKILVKEYEGKSITEILNSPASAIAGISEGDAEHLKAAFGIDTVAELGRNKYFRAAAALYDLHELSK